MLLVQINTQGLRHCISKMEVINSVHIGLIHNIIISFVSIKNMLFTSDAMTCRYN